MRHVHGGQRRALQGRNVCEMFLAFGLMLLFTTDVFVSAGITGHEYGEVISPLANAYRSRETLSPMEYYTLPMCKPPAEIWRAHHQSLLIGELLMGNRLVPTSFEFKVGENVKCARLCDASFTSLNIFHAMHMIERNYYVRMFLDDKPLVFDPLNNEGERYLLGYPLGNSTKENVMHKLHNHLEFTIRVKSSNVPGVTAMEVVGFKVKPMSVAQVTRCTETELVHSEDPYVLTQAVGKDGVQVPFTYSVSWEESTKQYVVEHQIAESIQRRGHKVAALYGVLLTVVVGVLVALVIVRTVRRDLAVYLDEELNDSEVREESGWKLVYGDVFRAPPRPEALATLVGAGCQIVVSLLTSVFLCAIKAVDSTHRGTFLSTVIFVFLAAHSVSGFVTARLLKLFNMTSWKKAVCCMFMFPGVLGCGVLVLNLVHWAKQSTATISFLSVFAIVCAWVFISLPFGVFGIYWGLKMDSLASTSRVSSIPRLIPEQASSSRLYYALAGSFVTFVACWAEMFFALNAFWREEPMYLYSLLTIFLLALMVLSAEVGIILTYFSLRREDYRWWWFSYASLSVTGLYLFVYSSFFLKRSLSIRALSSIILFLGYMLGVSVMFGMALGSIGFIGSLWLVRKMYSSIKAD